MPKLPTPDELLAATPASFPETGWMDTKADFSPGTYCYPAQAKSLNALGLPNGHEWNPEDEDWKLPENWENILYEGLRKRLEKHRSLKLFMDICVRCGACADKCHCRKHIRLLRLP